MQRKKLEDTSCWPEGPSLINLFVNTRFMSSNASLRLKCRRGRCLSRTHACARARTCGPSVTSSKFREKLLGSLQRLPWRRKPPDPGCRATSRGVSGVTEKHLDLIGTFNGSKRPFFPSLGLIAPSIQRPAGGKRNARRLRCNASAKGRNGED